MSFDIQWDTICNDEELALSFKEFLNSKLSTLELPHYLDNLQVIDFKFGNAAPEITIRDIGLPFNEFYSNSDNEDEDDDEFVENDSTLKKNKEFSENHKNSRISILKNQIQPTSRSPSPHPFMNKPNSLLLPRTNSGFVPTTMGYSGVGLGGFGMAGSNNQTNNNTNGSIESENEYFQPLINEYSNLNDESKNFSNLVFEKNTNSNSYFNNNNNSNNNNDNNNYQNSLSSREEIENEEDEEDEEENEKIDTSLDIQFSIDVKWDSELYVEIICDLLVNYPAPNFIRLPVRLKITDLKIHSLMIVAWISKKVFISFLCDIDSDDEVETEGDNSNVNKNESRQNSRRSTNTNVLNNRLSKGKERIDILRYMKIEGEIGNVSEGAELWRDNFLKPLQAQAQRQCLNGNGNNLNKTEDNEGEEQIKNFKDLDIGSGSNFLSGIVNNEDIGDGNGLVLRNIGKIEKFLMGAFRGLIINELAWPSWIELDFNEDLTDSEDDNSQSEGKNGNGNGNENENKNEDEDENGNGNEDGDDDNEINGYNYENEDNSIYKTKSGNKILRTNNNNNNNGNNGYKIGINDEKSGLRSIRSMRSTSTEGMKRTSSPFYGDDSSNYSSDSYFTSDEE